jgi:hypothetical protein
VPAPIRKVPAQTNALPEPPVQQAQADTVRLDVSGAGRMQGERFIMDFGSFPIGPGSIRPPPLPFQITNTGTRPVTLTREPRPDSAFGGKDSCTGRTIPVKAGCEGMVEFTPRAAGRIEESFDYYEDGQLRARILLRGTGIEDSGAKAQ